MEKGNAPVVRRSRETRRQARHRYHANRITSRRGRRGHPAELRAAKVELLPESYSKAQRREILHRDSWEAEGGSGIG